MKIEVLYAIPFPLEALHSFADTLLAHVTTPSKLLGQGGQTLIGDPLVFETAKTFVDASGLSLEGVVSGGLRSSHLLNGKRACSVLLPWSYLHSVHAQTGSLLAAVHVSSVLHDALAGVYQASGPVFTALVTERSWAAEHKRPTINELGRTLENVYLSIFESAWCLTSNGEDVNMSAVEVDWNGRFEYETTGSSVVLRPDNGATLGVARGVGGPNSWFCNDKICIHCDDETRQVTVYSLDGGIVARLDMRRWFAEPQRTLDLHPYARSFCFDDENWHVLLHDFEATGEVFAAPFAHEAPDSIALLPIATAEEPVIGWASVPGYRGSFYPRTGLGGRASFYLVNSLGRMSPLTSNGSEMSVTTRTGFSSAASGWSVFVSDHEGIVYEFDRQLRLASRFDLGAEALVTRCGEKVLAVTSEMIYECAPNLIRPLKGVGESPSAVD